MPAWNHEWGAQIAADFFTRYEAKYGAGTRDLFAGYAYDAYLLLDKAAGAAAKAAQPGTPAFRQALRDAIEGTNNLPATHGVISVSKTKHSVYDSASRVVVRIQDGGWRIVK